MVRPKILPYYPQLAFILFQKVPPLQINKRSSQISSIHLHFKNFRPKFTSPLPNQRATTKEAAATRSTARYLRPKFTSPLPNQRATTKEAAATRSTASMDAPAWRRWLGFLQLTKQTIPSAVHSVVIQIPAGAARTHRFATESPDVPAQEGERVTIALAAPSSAFREVGPFRFSHKPPKYYPSQPLCLTNHRDNRESLLLRAPSKDNKPSLLNPSVFLPLFVLLASGDAASGFINPSLPQLLPAAAAASFAMGATINTMVLPQLSQLPERMVDTIAVKQQLLSQYDMLQSRIKDLKDASENEVWMLARICKLENKIYAVGEPSYRARRTRIKRVREGLEISLRGRMELIDSYARISSMIEIEVEMDTDILAAEASSNTESIAKQIEQIMELENLEERWRQQAEANDGVERLLSSESLSSEQI